ncbi:glutamic acid-rich protein-like [Capsicum annuum]
MNKVLQNGENFHFKVTKNKSITAAKLISLMKGNRLNNQQKLKCALVWFMHAMLLAKDPSKKKTDLIEQKETFVKRNNASYGLFAFPWTFLVWIYKAFPHLGRYAGKSLDSPLPIPRLLRWHTSKCDNIKKDDPFKYKENNTKIVHPYLTPTVREMEQRYMKTFNTYMDKVKDTSIDALKAQLKGVIVLTSSVEIANEDKDLGGHHYVPSPPRACDHAGSSGLKTSPDASDDDDLQECVALLEKSLLNIASFVRDERLRRIDKNKKKQQEEVHLDNPLLNGIK